MHQAFLFRLHPTQVQQQFIHKNIGCSRFVFNHFLGKWNETYQETGKGLSYVACSRMLTQEKQERTWLKEVDATSLQNTLKHVADAFSRFFQKQNEAPRFKSRRNRIQAYTSHATIPKIADQPLKSIKIESNFPNWAG